MDGQSVAQHTSISNFLKYLIICGLISLVICAYNVFSPKGMVFSFWEWIAIVVFTTFIPGACVTCANFLRTLAHPDFIITNDGMKGILKARVFWAIGPQCVGWFIGFMITTQVLKALFNIAM